MTSVLHLKYRPKRFKDVVGQDAVVSALKGLIDSKGARSFLLSGPSGTGKTTLARIAAKELGHKSKDVLEIDAATHTGIDAMRQVQELLRYVPFGSSSGRAIIVDEAHMLSRSAWNSLLKVVEEPPELVSWFFCTTEPAKVPKTIRTRCAALDLRDVSSDDLKSLVLHVIKSESLKIEEDVVTVIVREASGSPRQALVNLSICLLASTRKEAAEALRSASESDVVLELCRFLVNKGSWLKAMAIVNKFTNENPESIRIAVCNYMGAALRNSKKDRQACHFLEIIDAFAEPYNSSEHMTPLLVSIGQVLLQSEE